MSDSSFVSILINSDPLSYAAGRFYVVFKKRVVKGLPTLPHTFEQLKNGPADKEASSIIKDSISVYPNPVVNKTLQIRFMLRVPGACRLQLINTNGQAVYSHQVQLMGPDISWSIKLDPSITAGTYLLRITTPNGDKSAQKIIVN